MYHVGTKIEFNFNFRQKLTSYTYNKDVFSCVRCQELVDIYLTAFLSYAHAYSACLQNFKNIFAFHGISFNRICFYDIITIKMLNKQVVLNRRRRIVQSCSSGVIVLSKVYFVDVFGQNVKMRYSCYQTLTFQCF